MRCRRSFRSSSIMDARSVVLPWFPYALMQPIITTAAATSKQSQTFPKISAYTPQKTQRKAHQMFFFPRSDESTTSPSIYCCCCTRTYTDRDRQHMHNMSIAYRHDVRAMCDTTHSICSRDHVIVVISRIIHDLVYSMYVYTSSIYCYSYYSSCTLLYIS